MDTDRFSIVFEKLSAETATEPEVEQVIRDSDEIAELRRIVQDVNATECLYFTTT